MKTDEKYIVFREARKTYQVKITVLDENGVKHCITKQSKSLEQAIEIRDQLCKLYRLDTDLLKTICSVNAKDEDQALLKNQIRNWYEIKKTEIELQTQRRYNNIIEKVIIPIFGHLDVNQVNKRMIQQSIISLHLHGYAGGTKTGMAVSSLHVYGTLLKQFFDFLEMSPNPVIGVHYPKSDKIKRDYLNDEELQKVLTYIKHHSKDKYFLYKMYAETGCRRGELLGLTWRYVNFDAKTITIQRTLINNCYTSSYEMKNTPKNKSSIRDIYIGDGNMSRLRLYYAYACKHDTDFSTDSLVFLNRNRKPYSPKKISETFKNAVKKCGIDKNVSLHSCRHSFATKLISNNVPLNLIQLIGGWGKATTLLNTYVHGDNQLALQAMQKVNLETKVL